MSQWIEWWTQYKFDGLADHERPGRPPKLSLDEQTQAVEIVQEEPRSTRRAVAEIVERLKKK